MKIIVFSDMFNCHYKNCYENALELWQLEDENGDAKVVLKWEIKKICV